MGEAFAYGYGTTLESLELRKDAASRLLDIMSEKRQKRMVAEWRKNMPDLDWDDAFTVIFLSEGPEKMMADIINENCFEGRKVITGEKGALYADPVFPKSESDRSRIPTEKEIRDAIAEHLQVAYKGVRKRDIDYYFFEDD